VGPLACILGGVHGQVRLDQQFGCVRAVVAGRGADAGVHGQLVVADAEGPAQRRQDPARQLSGFLVADQPLYEHRELVAAEAGAGVLRSHRPLQAFTHGDQKCVARRVTTGVVDHLEVVEVDQHDGQPLAVAALPCQRVLDTVEEQRSIGELGERVMEGEVLELVLQCTSIGGVMKGQHEPVNHGVLEQVGAGHLERPQVAVRVKHSPLVVRLRIRL
jgi:hypothetical protein